jgi:RNA polymerase sigma-70 factor (ECF subfamily)
LITKTDRQLVEAAKGGDVTSFGVLYKRYYDCMVALAYSMTGDVHLSEDAAQQTFATACGNLEKLKSKEKFGAWLAGICRNTARHMYRCRNKTVVLDDEVAAPQREGEDGKAAAVRQAVWKLAGGQREVVVLRFFKGLPYERIGDVLGISPDAVHGRLIRAKRKIKKHLKYNGFTGGDHESARQ